MKRKKQIQYHLDCIDELLSNCGEFRIRTPDLSRYEYGPCPEELAKRWWEGFNSPQIKTRAGWKLMKYKNNNWTIK